MAVTPNHTVHKSEDERAILSPEQFQPRGMGHYDKFYEEAVHNCAGCGTPLFRSTTKFDSGCGLWWNLGHVFKGEGHPVPTYERHCVNSVLIKFVPPAAASAPTCGSGGCRGAKRGN